MADQSEKELNEREKKIVETIEKVRPFLQRDGGDISFDHYDEETGTVFIKVVGACMGCFFIGPEITNGVSLIIQEEVPEVNAVQIVEPSPDELQERGYGYPPNPFGAFPEDEMEDPVTVELKDDEKKSDD